MVEVGPEEPAEKEREREAVIDELVRKGGTRWDPVDHLKTDADLHYYLEAAALEDSGDGGLIRAALSDVARAQQRNMTHLAQAAGMTREGLYKALSDKGNPSFATVLKIARALDLRLRIEPALHDPAA